MITGGRSGVVGGRAILVLSESQVKDISHDAKLKKRLRAAVNLCRKVSVRSDPLEIPAVSGVMGIRG